MGQRGTQIQNWILWEYPVGQQQLVVEKWRTKAKKAAFTECNWMCNTISGDKEQFKKLLPSCTAASHSLFHLLHFSVQSLVSHSKADLCLMDHFANIYHLKEKQNEKKQNTLSLLLSVIFDPNLKTFCCRGVKCLICTLLLFENLNLSSMEWV